MKATDLAKRFEGCRLEAYRDALGYPTQGWGHLLTRDRNAPLDQFPPVSQAQADDWLELDMARAIASVRRLVPIAFSAGQMAALGDFVFNLGSGCLQVSTLRRRILAGEDTTGEWLKWVYAGKVKLPGLVRRRQAEQAAFLGLN